MKMVKINTLYVGGDDSNHAGTSKGEIIVSTFSILEEDSIIKKFKNKRSYSLTKSWLENQSRDYRLTALVADKYRHSNQNLAEIVPLMIEGYLVEENIFPEKLNIYLDGFLKNSSANHVKKAIKERLGIEKIIVQGFTKKNKNSEGNVEKRPNCPTLVYHADVLANYFNTLSFLKITNSDKFMVLK